MNEEETVDYDKMNIIGDEAYQVLCISRKKERQRERLDEILADTVVSNEDYYLIKQGSRKRILTEYKFKFIKEALKQHYTYQEIGQSIRISGNAVKDIINRYMNIDDKSKEQLRALQPERLVGLSFFLFRMMMLKSPTE